MRIVIAIILASVLASCRKEAVLDPVPEIVLVSAGPQQVVAFDEPVILRFTYADGDGDLGTDDPDAYTLWVKDSRLGTADGYHIPPLAPPDAEVAIRGELEVELTPLFLLGNSGQEVMTYSFHITDRAGNRSNELTTPAITVVADTAQVP
ncbi:MAG: hypothetical protein IPG35_03765 [Flavobacteriales bacterium]|jgi:hypothetical protein|nr:hypothetical protein [Flavobacteriales bacterium]MBK8947284.1 hypothetical protein [Flavobacteriales bacterium]